MGSLVKPIVTALVALLFVGTAATQGPPGSRPESAPTETTTQKRHTPPERPRAVVDMPASASSGRTVHVKAGDSLQAAIDNAQPGDRITLEPGAVYKGPFRLPRKTGNQWIVITSASEARLPARGQRIARTHAALMPKLVASGDYVIAAMPGAHHYQLV